MFFNKKTIYIVVELTKVNQCCMSCSFVSLWCPTSTTTPGPPTLPGSINLHSLRSKMASCPSIFNCTFLEVSSSFSMLFFVSCLATSATELALPTYLGVFSVWCLVAIIQRWNYGCCLSTHFFFYQKFTFTTRRFLSFVNHSFECLQAITITTKIFWIDSVWLELAQWLRLICIVP